MNEENKKAYNFDNSAARYDSWYSCPIGSMYDRLEKHCISNILGNVGKGKKLLEVGCGTGHWSKFFAENGFNVVGVDISEKMVKIAKTKSLPNCSFELADAQSLKYDSGSFDCAAAITLLEFAQEPEKIVEQMLRCVNSSGVLIIGTLNGLNKNINEKSKHNSYSAANFFTPNSLENLLSRFGKVKIKVAGFVIEKKLFLPFSPVWEKIAKSLNMQTGAFIAARVDL